MDFFPERKQSEYIRIYEDVFTESECQKAIQVIETADQKELDEMRKRQKMLFWIHYIPEGPFKQRVIEVFTEIYLPL